MKKTVLIIILSIIVIVAGYLILGKNSTLFWKTVKNTEYSFSIKCPTGWSVSRNDKFISCDRVVTMGGAMTSVEIRVNDTTKNLDDVIAKTFILVKKDTYQFQNESIDGATAALYISSQPNSVSHPEFYFVTKNNRIYIIAVSSASWDRDKKTIDNIIGTIKFN